MTRLFFLFICLVSHALCNAQMKNMYSNIRSDLKGEKSAFIGLDGKNSIVRDVPIKLFGIQAGYLFNKRTNLFLGFYNSHNKENIISNPSAGAQKTDSNTIWQAYKLTYINFGCEYYFHNSKKWRFSIPMALGIGGGSIKQRNIAQEISKKSLFVVPAEVGFFANYKLTWWLWLGAGMGTRVSLVSKGFTGSYYTFGFSLRYGEIYNRGKAFLKKK